LAPSTVACSKNSSSSTSQFTSLRTCVIVLGSFTLKRKCSGTLSCHRCHVESRC